MQHDLYDLTVVENSSSDLKHAPQCVIWMSVNSDVIGSVEDVTMHTTDTRFDLLFTDSKIIAANVLHPSDVIQFYTKRFDLEQLVIGGAMQMHQVQEKSRRIADERRQRFKSMTLTEILASHNSNFEILYSDIVSAKVVKNLLGTKLQFDTRTNDKFRRIKFRINEAQFETARKILQQALPNKLA